MYDEPTLIDLPPATACAHTEAEYAMGEVLGTGGMSEVRLAHQPLLNRWVAVKSATSAAGEEALLTEARVVARLNHPGIVPVIDLGHDEQGRTALFMRRIEGRTWRSYVGPDGRLAAPDSWEGDPLSWHLDVMCRVARVLEHAHEMGIVHRDVKPGNVMIGDHGQVWLLDWGLAVAIDDRQPDLPRALDIDRFSGTTGHAAPEMLDTRHRLIGVRTDVYQLGTCLHLLLTGRPPHADRKVADRLRSILRSEPPTYPDTVPPGLAAICHRAMARRPADRFPSVAMLRRAVESVGVELRSTERAQEGLRLLIVLRRAIAEGRPREQITEAFAEARYVLRAALRIWPENPMALEGLQTLCETVIHNDLVNGRPARARRLLDDLPHRRPDLEARLERPDAAVRLLPPRGWLGAG